MGGRCQSKIKEYISQAEARVGVELSNINHINSARQQGRTYWLKQQIYSGSKSTREKKHLSFIIISNFLMSSMRSLLDLDQSRQIPWKHRVTGVIKNEIYFVMSI